MPANQRDALAIDPNALNLERVATYKRRVKASLSRVWENVLDWEHLPHLHDASFNYCELDEVGAWGWRVWSDKDHDSHIELCVDNDCYVARSYKDGEQFSEIWTHLEPSGDSTAIRVEFYSIGVTENNRDNIGQVYLGLYETLWDEDEAMMCERQQRLEQSRDPRAEINLGSIAQLRESVPVNFELGRKEYRLSETPDGWVATPTICPHLLGPLELSEQPGQLRCPWHGYVFDRQTGKCVSPADSRCSLGQPPRILEQDDELIVAIV
ncbi:MAG: Rieske (2Fe-2S) protein [Halioglobus sp.]